MKFKAKNWDFGREEWNNYHCKSILLYKSELLTDQWGETNIIRELCYKGEEREREGEREREREREIYGRGETIINDSKGVRREKAKGREKKWENLSWERDCFPKKIGENTILVPTFWGYN